jgi:CBS domain-containing protein
VQDRTSRGIRVQAWFGEADQVGGRPVHQAVLEYLRSEGAAGATLIRGIAGFGANSRIHSAAVLRLSLDLPVVLVWIDAPDRVERLLPHVRALIPGGLVTMEEVGIVTYGMRAPGQLRFDLPVADVMTEPVTAPPDTSLRDAVTLLVERELRSLPVVDDAGRLLGIVTNADLARGGVPARVELIGSLDEADREHLLAAIPERTIGEVMTREGVTVSPGGTLGDAARLMARRRLKRLPVVDDGGRLVGILSRADVLRAVAESFPRVGGAPRTVTGARTVAEVMRSDVPVVDAGADLSTVLDAVVSSRLHRAIVIDRDRRVVGILSDRDVLRAVEPGAREGVVGSLMGRGSARPTSQARAVDLAARDVPTVTEGTSLAGAAELMVSARRKLLPVVDAEGVLLGGLDRADLLRGSARAFELAAASDAEDD